MLIVSITLLCMLYYLLLFVDILLLSVWISDETLPLVFDILLLGDWISDELLLVFGYQMKHSLSCLMCYVSVFGYQMNHSVLCVIYYL